MSERLYGGPITRIREELEPNGAFRLLMGAFLKEQSRRDEQIRLYTTAQRDVPSFDPETRSRIGAADDRLRELAGRALIFGGQVFVSENGAGLTLSFDVQDRQQWVIDDMARALNEIEEQEVSNTRLYVPLARAALVDSQKDWRMASERLVRTLGNPDLRERLQARNVQLKTRELPGPFDYNYRPDDNFPDTLG